LLGRRMKRIRTFWEHMIGSAFTELGPRTMLKLIIAASPVLFSAARNLS
jgi:hypothetical protein